MDFLILLVALMSTSFNVPDENETRFIRFICRRSETENDDVYFSSMITVNNDQ